MGMRRQFDGDLVAMLVMILQFSSEASNRSYGTLQGRTIVGTWRVDGDRFAILRFEEPQIVQFALLPYLPRKRTRSAAT